MMVGKTVLVTGGTGGVGHDPYWGSRFCEYTGRLFAHLKQVARDRAREVDALLVTGRTFDKAVGGSPFGPRVSARASPGSQ
jgi:hypothetical protein